MTKFLASFSGMLIDIQEDIDRFIVLDGKHWLYHLLIRQGLWVMLQYRVSHWVKFHFHLPLLRQLLRLLCFIWQKLTEITTGCEISTSAQIGRGLVIIHAHSIVVHPDTQIGEYCSLGQDSTIGVGGRGENQGVPCIGDRVHIGPGARLFGKITIGNDVAIGANAVVTKSIPDNAVAVGIPAKVINYNGSQDWVKYRERVR